MERQKLVYFSAEGLTFYVDVNDTEVGDRYLRDLLLHCDYAFSLNGYKHWQFIKNRNDGDCVSEYFELKDLLEEIPLHTMYQNRKTLNKCKFIVSPTHAQQVIDMWKKARRDIDALRTPWYEQ